MKKTIGILILLVGSSSFVAYAMNPASNEKPQVNIHSVSHHLHPGAYYEGGVIYWLDPSKSNKHGLIADINEAPNYSGYAWDTTPPSKTGASDNTAYAGKKNTQLIISSIGSARAQAAYTCANSKAQGYSDWYLPSEYELNLLLDKHTMITNTAKLHGGTAVSHHPYWTSKESYRNSALNLTLVFGSGIHKSTYNKSNKLSVRCIRAF